jgi:hypothetical protein
VWLVEEFAGLQGEIEDPFQDGELAVEFSVRHACNGAALFRHMRAGPGPSAGRRTPYAPSQSRPGASGPGFERWRATSYLSKLI